MTLTRDQLVVCAALAQALSTLAIWKFCQRLGQYTKSLDRNSRALELSSRNSNYLATKIIELQQKESA